MMKNGIFPVALIGSLLFAGGCQDWNESFARLKAKKKQPASQTETARQEPPEKVAAEPVVAQGESDSSAASEGSPAGAVQDYIQNLEQAESADRSNGTGVAQKQPPATGDERASAGPTRANESVALPRAGGSSPQAAPSPAAPHVLAVSLGGDTSLASEREASPTLGVHRGMDTSSADEGVSLEKLIEQAKADVKAHPADARRQWRLSLLQLAAGRPADAGRISDSLSPEARRLTSHIVRTVSNASDLLDDPLSGADRTLAALDAFRGSLREEAELLVPVVALCSRVTTFGVYDSLPDAALKPYQANRAIVYCEVDNFTVEDAGREGYRSLLATRIELFTDDGRSVWSHEEERIEDTSQQQREDFFLAQLVTFPADLGPGQYVLKVAVTDVLSSKTNEGVHRFHIGGVGATTSAAR